MSKPTFAERCLLAEQCLPDAPYRAMLKKLHAEMLEALAEQPAQRTWQGLTDEEFREIYKQTDWDIVGGWEYERAIEAKLKEKNT